MGIIGFTQRRRTNQLLADQLSVMQTGQTRGQIAGQRGRDEEARVLAGALIRRGTDPELATWYTRRPPEQRKAWREANPGMIK